MGTLRHKDSYDSEGKYVSKEGGRMEAQVMGNGNGRVSLDFVLRVSQVLVIPLLAATFAGIIYVLSQMNTFDRRLAVIEVTTSRPTADVELVRKIAVIEDRQNGVMKQLQQNGDDIRKIGEAISEHDARENYRRGR